MLQQDTMDYPGEHGSHPGQLALARQQPACAWYAAAYDQGTGRFAGRAWSFLNGNLSGIFDMAVWERFRRQGRGTALLSTVCAAAHAAGAQHAVLNATPEGWQLYRWRGFTQIGEGITWWHHLNPP
jgi:GNAT superfamily N-acetyltransferase